MIKVRKKIKKINIKKMINAQEWLEKQEKYNTKEKREGITELIINDKNLIGSLSLTNFSNLVRLEVNNNQIDELDLSDCISLEKLDCSNNKLNLLDVSPSYKLKELDCSNNDLKDFILPPEADLLEKINFQGNSGLKFGIEEVDKYAIKYLPILSKGKEVDTVVQSVFSKKVEEWANKNGEFKEAKYFSTWWNPNCCLFIKRFSLWIFSEHYSIALSIYIPAKAEKKEIYNTIFLGENFPSIDKAREELEKIFEKLKSENPIEVISSAKKGEICHEHLIIKNKLPSETRKNPDEYISPMDIIWRASSPDWTYHAGVYLGNKRVAHISAFKVSGINKKTSHAITTNWDSFALEKDQEMYSVKFLIPFLKPDKIQDYLIKFIVGEYGEKDYHLIGKNCENFADLCITGISFSTQVEFIENRLMNGLRTEGIPWTNWEIDFKEIERNKKLFEKVNFGEIEEAKKSFSLNRLNRIRVIENKINKPSEEKELAKQLQFEVDSLKKLYLNKEEQAQIQISPKD